MVESSFTLLFLQKKCAEFYKGEPDAVKFNEVFNGPISYMEKLKVISN